MARHEASTGTSAASGFVVDVDPAWLDYNGHVTDSAYAVIAAAANEAWCVTVDLSEPYRSRTGCALYTAQLTIRYRQEISAGDAVQVLRTVERLGSSSLTMSTRICVGDEVAADSEHVYVHVDSASGRAVPFGPEHRRRLEPLVGCVV